jgi:type IV pilus assembly protein PilA
MSLVERCRQRHLGNEGEDEGFTLIELLVVLLIIGILLAIAIPTFLSVTKGANNTASQSNLQNALTGAKTYYTDSNQTYTDLGGLGSPPVGANPLAGTSDIEQIGTGLSYVTTASTGAHVISFNIAGTGSVLEMAAWSPGSNDCWLLVDVTGAQATAITGFTGSTQAGTFYGVVHASTQALCVAGVSVGAVAANQSTTGFPSP